MLNLPTDNLYKFLAIFGLIITLFFALTRSVRAECAWILWKKIDSLRSDQGYREGVWEAERALKTMEEYQGLLTHYIKVETSGDIHPTVKRDIAIGDTNGLIRTSGKYENGIDWSFERHFRCFPDTIDPRTPKR